MIELKPCPFCGSGRIEFGEGWSADADIHGPTDTRFVYCMDCGAEAGIASCSEEEAADHWNNRAVLDIKHRISPFQYQKAAMRTADEDSYDIGNAGLGIAGEAGEVADLIKKHLYQHHELDKDELVKEIGDTLWYAALACDIIGVSMTAVMEKNIAKLWDRYPNGFEAERSIHREENDA